MAARAMLEGDYERAISLYRQLAETSPSPESHEYRYLAAQAMFRAGLSNQANEQLDILAGRALTPDLRMKLQLLRAELPIKRDPTITLELLRTPAVMEHQLALSNELYARYHLLRARAFAQLGEQFDASRE
ncbi:MAG: penicillin-binding protein activator, partial [Gammaproteobacteria bacterium]|nr:penicillin-binding protein activator [Gammaproteobacteria bacterium]